MKKIIQVSLNGETTYMTPAAYEEYRLQLSSSDFAVHKKRVLRKLPKSVPAYMIRDAEFFNPRVKYPTIESIIEAYQDADQAAEDSVTSEESPLAEFVSSFFYGKADISQILDASRLENETRDLLKAHWERLGSKATYNLLSSVSELILGDIYYRDGEILSATLGEQEHQVDDTLAKAFQILTEKEKERVRRESGAGLSSSGDGRFIFTSNDYSRWIMRADEERLARKLRRALQVQGGAR